MPGPLDSYIPVCDAIALLFRPHAEVVLHNLATQQIAYIANAYSKRRVGDSSLTEADLAFDLTGDVIGPYAKTNWDGRRLKSITSVLRDADRRAIGLLCINYDLNAVAGALDQLRALIELPAPSAPPAVLLARDWRETVNAIVGAFLAERRATLAGLARSDVDELLAELERHGIFAVRRAVPYVAELLGLSRATIYKRLGKLKVAG